MKAPRFLPVDCPVCHVMIMVPVSYTGTVEVTVTIDQTILRDHAAAHLRAIEREGADLSV